MCIRDRVSTQSTWGIQEKIHSMMRLNHFLSLTLLACVLLHAMTQAPSQSQPNDPSLKEFLSDTGDFTSEPVTEVKKVPIQPKPVPKSPKGPVTVPKRKVHATVPVTPAKPGQAAKTGQVTDPALQEFLKDTQDFDEEPQTGDKVLKIPKVNSTKPPLNKTRPPKVVDTAQPDPIKEFLNDKEDFYVDPSTGQPVRKIPIKDSKKNITNPKNTSRPIPGRNNNSNKKNGSNSEGISKRNGTKRRDDGISLGDEKLGKFLSRPLTNADYFSNTTYTHLLIQQARSILKIRKLTFKYESKENGDLAVKAGKAYNFTITSSPVQIHIVFRVSQDAARAIASALEEVLDNKAGAINVQFATVNNFNYVKLIIHQTQLPTFSQKVFENGSPQEWTYALQTGEGKRFEIGVKFKTGFDLDKHIGENNQVLLSFYISSLYLIISEQSVIRDRLSLKSSTKKIDLILQLKQAFKLKPLRHI
eukprot:TRINITY_DN4079_c0_g1_i1.p1 TRINITY_DN4079_c0_g1~~TRINITY_DN4079_c0_g1_i1.p1  ORF type:complete len:473 (+),score=72.45 TRINITY_DN4079_c0_g1_i1:66-1484(+)